MGIAGGANFLTKQKQTCSIVLFSLLFLIGPLVPHISLSLSLKRLKWVGAIVYRSKQSRSSTCIGVKKTLPVMASSASMDEQRNQESEPQPQQLPQPEAVKECMHKTKVIQFFGRTLPIVLQNDNGPCPLLAICMCLSHQS